MSRLVIGIGNRYRSDDAIGPIVAESLGGMEIPGDASPLLEIFTQADEVLIIDAVQSGAPPGTIHKFDAKTNPLPAAMFASSTHSFGVAEAIEIARVLNQLPSRVTVIGIEGKNFNLGTTLTPEVEDAAVQIRLEIT